MSRVTRSTPSATPVVFIATGVAGVLIAHVRDGFAYDNGAAHPNFKARVRYTSASGAERVIVAHYRSLEAVEPDDSRGWDWPIGGVRGDGAGL